MDNIVIRLVSRKKYHFRLMARHSTEEEYYYANVDAFVATPEKPEDFKISYVSKGDYRHDANGRRIDLPAAIEQVMQRYAFQVSVLGLKPCVVKLLSQTQIELQKSA